VRSDEWIDYRTMDEIEEGIFCPKVFGSPHHPRRRRFGHIELEAPVISLLWRLGKPSSLERLLGIPGAIAEKIIYGKLGVRRDGDQWEIMPLGANHQPEPELLTSAAAIEAML
jgi:DNA-directed RNA polymerase beta' subunit